MASPGRTGGEWGFFLVMIAIIVLLRFGGTFRGPLVNIGGATETPSLDLLLSRPRLSLPRIKLWESRIMIMMMAVAPLQGATA
jgi:hypothetical protein